MAWLFKKWPLAIAPNFSMEAVSFLKEVLATLKLGWVWAAPNKQEILAIQAIINRFIEE
jgi:hypothetical protein